MARIGSSSRSLGPSLAATGAAGKLPPGASLCDQAYAPYYGKKMFATAYVTRTPATKNGNVGTQARRA
jgi:multiple sugar transport system substrate-binding protein